MTDDTVVIDAISPSEERAIVPEEPATKFVANADVQPMDAKQAGQLLARLRHQAKPAPVEAKAPPVEPTESEAAPPAEDASAPEALPGEAQEAEPAPPAIEPPRSWTKEARERFASLPHETQQYVAQREQEREREISRVQNEAAEARKAAEAERGKVEQARQQYEGALPQLLQTLQSQQAGEFADVKSFADVEKMAREDWPRYMLYTLHQQKMNAVQQEMAQINQRSQQEKQQKFQEYAREQDKRFAERHPEVSDAKRAAELQQSAVNLLDELGFNAEERAKAWNGHELSLRDHRLQSLIVDAIKYREMTAKAKTLTSKEKPVPPVQRPGAAQNKGAILEERINALVPRLGNKGTDGLRAGAELLRLQRQAGQRR